MHNFIEYIFKDHVSNFNMSNLYDAKYFQQHIKLISIDEQD